MHALPKLAMIFVNYWFLGICSTENDLHPLSAGRKVPAMACAVVEHQNGSTGKVAGNLRQVAIPHSHPLLRRQWPLEM